MAAKRTDRRIARTRRLLQDALIELMSEKGYEATTVQEIIDRANVGRATFYAHFESKRALLESRLEALRDLLAGHRSRAPLRFGFSLAMLEHARDHLALYRSIAGRESGGFAMKRIHQIISDLVDADLKSLGVLRGAQQQSLAAEFVAGAFMSVMTWWLERGAAIAPQDIDASFRRLVTQGVGGQTGSKIPSAH
jgi:AcrR family transcriptional regulator